MNCVKNIEALKKLSNVLIDFQHAQNLGMEIFNHQGEITDKIVESSEAFCQTCDSILAGVQEIKGVTSGYKVQ